MAGTGFGICEKVNSGATVLCLLVGPVVAQEAVAVCASVVCVGALSEACMARDVTEAGACMDAEVAVWAARGAVALETLTLAQAGAEQDTEQVDYGEFRTLFELYRTRACGAEQFGGGWALGVGERDVEAECLLRLTAEHVLYLEHLTR